MSSYHNLDETFFYQNRAKLLKRFDVRMRHSKQGQEMHYEQILISPKKPFVSLSDTEKLLTDNCFLLGSTELTGQLILSQLSQPWVYLNVTDNIQSMINKLATTPLSTYTLGRTEVKAHLEDILTSDKIIKVIKNVFCLNRRAIHFNSPFKVEDLNADWEHTIEYEGIKYLCCKENVTVDLPSLKHGVLAVTPHQGIEDIFQINLQLQEFKYEMHYLLTDPTVEDAKPQIIPIEIKVNILVFLEERFAEWPRIMTSIFKKSDSKIHILIKDSKESIPWTIPSLAKISTLISALESNPFQEEVGRCSREFVDYELIMQMARRFVSVKDSNFDKKMVLVTSFNHHLLSSTSKHYKRKVKLEQDLISQVNGLNQLIILRPGPLVGSRLKSFVASKPPENIRFPIKNLAMLYYFKKNCIEFNSYFIGEIAEAGARTVFSELFVDLIYQTSISWIFGYAVPAQKVAAAAAVKAVSQMLGDSELQVIKSDEIDNMF